MIRLQLLGSPAVVGPDIAPDAATRLRRSMALLAVVAAAAPQAVARDKLLAMLWPESDTERARLSLRQTLYTIRRDLGEEIFLVETPVGLQLDSAHVSTDIWDFATALRRECFQDAVACYGGPFLDGFHIPGLAAWSEWVESERARYARQFVDTLDALAHQAEREGRAGDALAWRRRQSDADPLSSSVALALLKALVAHGDRPGAIAYAAQYERTIRQRLEVEPDPVVAGYVAELRSMATPVSSPRISPTPAPSVNLAVDTPADAPSPAAAPARAIDDTPVRRRLAWALAGAAIATVVIGAGVWSVAAASHDAPIILTSGSNVEDGRDRYTSLVACEGPGCPATLPQDAFAVAKHDAYATPSAGTGYISFAPNAVSLSAPGYACCTRATFERVFSLPTDAVNAMIAVSVHADNVATVKINGVEFGHHADTSDQGNFSDLPEVWRTNFVPKPGPNNRLHVILWNSWGASAVYYSAVVTYELPRDTTRPAAHD